MSKQLEDISFKRLTERFPVPMLKYLKIQYEMAKTYPTKIELENNQRQFLDHIIQIHEDKLLDLEFHSGILTFKILGHYGTYKINLRVDSDKFVYQRILCTSDPKLSKRQLVINESEEVKLDIIFTLEDDADEKLKILEELIYNNKKITSTDVEIIYLTVALYMKTTLTKSELLLKLAKLTNEIQGLSEEDIYEIKLFQKAFMRKFIDENDKLKKEIDKMISLSDVELMKELFPKEAQDLENSGIEQGEKQGIEKGIEKVAKNMKKQGYKPTKISEITELDIKTIEKL